MGYNIDILYNSPGIGKINDMPGEIGYTSPVGGGP